MSGRNRRFCSVRAEFHDHRRDHRHAERHHRGCADARAFEVEDVVLRRGETRAAVFLRPVDCGPTSCRQRLLPAHVIFFRQAAERTACLTFASFLRPRGREPVAHFLLEFPVGVAERQIHVQAPRQIKGADSNPARPGCFNVTDNP